MHPVKNFKLPIVDVEKIRRRVGVTKNASNRPELNKGHKPDQSDPFGFITPAHITETTFSYGVPPFDSLVDVQFNFSYKL